MIINEENNLNLLKLLEDEIEEKGQNWNTIEKALYIYKRTCQIFNYDERWHNKRNQAIVDEIYDKELDIENITDPRVVCSSWSKLYCDLANEILMPEDDFDFAGVIGEGVDGSHCTVLVSTIDNQKLRLDPVISNAFLDFSKETSEISILSTIRYIDFNSDDAYLDELKLEKYLRNIGYDYTVTYNDYLKLLREELESKQILAKNGKMSDENLNKLFRYFLKTTNFEGLGLKEANRLIYDSMNKVLKNDIMRKRFEREIQYAYDGTATYNLKAPNKEGTMDEYEMKRDENEQVVINRRK